MNQKIYMAMVSALPETPERRQEGDQVGLCRGEVVLGRSDLQDSRRFQ